MGTTKREIRNKLDRIIYLQRLNDAVVLLLEGKDTKEIIDYVVSKYLISKRSAENLLRHARDKVKERKNFEVDNLVTIHIARYEHIYAKLYKMRMFINAQIALKQKEKLMGFHKEGFHMKVTQGEITAIGLQKVVDEYNVMLLPEEKRKRLDELLQRAKLADSERPSKV